MSLKNYSRDELAETSMIELANLILLEEKKAITYQEMYDRIASMKKFTKAQKADNIAQFYTDLNTDGRFLTLGSNLWGLKRWYPVEQMDEEIHTAPKKKKAKKKKKKKVVDDDFDVEIDEGLDDLDDEDLDYDDAVIDEDDDFDLDDDLDDDSDDDEEEDKPKTKAAKDDSYDGDFRSGKLDDEDQEIVKQDITYTGEDDDDDANDDKKF